MSCAHHIAGIPFCPLVFPFPAYQQGKKHQKQGKTGQKLRYICLLLCFLGILGDKKVQNLNIFLKVREGEQLERWSAACLLRVHWCRCAGSLGFRTCRRLLWSSGGVFPSFCPLCCSSLGALSANMALFRILRAFLEGFMGFVWVCIGQVLCVACGAFVCVSG